MSVSQPQLSWGSKTGKDERPKDTILKNKNKNPYLLEFWSACSQSLLILTSCVAWVSHLTSLSIDFLID